MDLDHIYNVAEKHFFAKQYNDVKLDNIANELEIKKPSLYYYFENKREFFIKTLKFSMKNYLAKMREVINKNDLFDFLHWYLAYPSAEKNLFAIASQQWYGDDNEINHIIMSGRQVINTEVERFLKWFDIQPITVYLICNLLDKLAMDNCTDGYCLDYSVTDLTEAIEQLIK